MIACVAQRQWHEQLTIYDNAIDKRNRLMETFERLFFLYANSLRDEFVAEVRRFVVAYLFTLRDTFAVLPVQSN